MFSGVFVSLFFIYFWRVKRYPNTTIGNFCCWKYHCKSFYQLL